MNRRSFLFQLSGLSILIAVSLYLLNFVPQIQMEQSLSWLSLGFFILFTIVVYYAAYNAALSDNLNSFTRLIMAVVMGKMFLCVLLIFLYVKFAVPESNYFLIPFFLVYFAYTIFELHFMTKLGKMKRL